MLIQEFPKEPIPAAGRQSMVGKFFIFS